MLDQQGCTMLASFEQGSTLLGSISYFVNGMNTIHVAFLIFSFFFHSFATSWEGYQGKAASN